VVAALPLLFTAFLVLRNFIRISSGEPWDRWVAERMGLGSVVLVSAVIPYLCILWYARKNPPHENDRVWAVGTGCAWLACCAAIILLPFTDPGSMGDPRDAEIIPWIPILWAALGLPHVGVITCAMKVYPPTPLERTSLLTDGTVRLHANLLQLETVAMAFLLVFPYLCLSGPLWKVVDSPTVALIWLLVLCAEVPYVFMLTRLRSNRVNRNLIALATALALSWLTLLATATMCEHFTNLMHIKLGWKLGAYWLTFGLIQIAILISAQGTDRELARASQGNWKLPWRAALPPICFGVFLFVFVYCTQD
jgi:hypothetical protein